MNELLKNKGKFIAVLGVIFLAVTVATGALAFIFEDMDKTSIVSGGEILQDDISEEENTVDEQLEEDKDNYLGDESTSEDDLEYETENINMPADMREFVV